LYKKGGKWNNFDRSSNLEVIKDGGRGEGYQNMCLLLLKCSKGKSGQNE